MGSLEEERLFQMVHDFIEPESTPPIFSLPSESPPLNHHTQYVILQEILGSGRSYHEIQILECVLKHLKSKMEAEDTTTLKRWLVMRLKMDGYNASLCQTSWVTTSGCPGGDYEYIDVMMKEGNKGRLIVDIDFKSQFELARPTSAYKELSETLPPIFVGDEQKLKKIICLLCSAAKQSLRERGLHIPPWRTTNYMHSKWLSPDSHRLTMNITTTFSREENSHSNSNSNREAKSKFSSKWAPPMVKPKIKRDFSGGSGSGLSSQFSTLSTKCC